MDEKEMREAEGKARKWDWTSRGERGKASPHTTFLSSWLLAGLAQILRLARRQGDILLPGATLWFGRSQGRPKQTVTLSHASLLFRSDTTIYRLRLRIPWLSHTHVPTLTVRHWNKHLVLKIAVIHLFFFCPYHTTGSQQFSWVVKQTQNESSRPPDH